MTNKETITSEEMGWAGVGKEAVGIGQEVGSGHPRVQEKSVRGSLQEDMERWQAQVRVAHLRGAEVIGIGGQLGWLWGSVADPWLRTKKGFGE